MVFDQRDHFGDFAEDLFCGMPAGDPDVVIPNPFAIVERLGRPERRTPGSSHLPVLLPDEIVDTGLSLPCPASRERMPLSISARNARSFSTCESSVRPICS